MDNRSNNFCSQHKRDILGVSDMETLAAMIGDLHYETLQEFLYLLSKKFDADSEKDNEAGRENLASALQYSSQSVFESSLRIGKVWEICKPFMQNPILTEEQIQDGLREEFEGRREDDKINKQ